MFPRCNWMKDCHVRYTWIRVKDHEQQTTVDTGLPFPSPTLVGCAIAVDRDYFAKIGAFDEGMRIWGGENIELGFRTWMCGGQVKTVTCSRVGHVFKVSHMFIFFNAQSVERQYSGTSPACVLVCMYVCMCIVH